MTNEALAELILPWALEQKPEQYQKTLAVAGRPDTFRRYLLRLVEIRYSEEPGWRTEVPLSVLEETAVVQKMRTSAGTEFTVAGARQEGRTWSFKELAWLMEKGASKEDVETLAAAKARLDLSLVDVGSEG